MERLRTPYIVPWHPWPGRCPSARTRVRVRADGGASARTHGHVRADAPPSARARVRLRGRTTVRADAAVLPPGNFKKDATVRPSHGRPHGHRPIVRPSVRPSVRKCPRDNPGLECRGSRREWRGMWGATRGEAYDKGCSVEPPHRLGIGGLFLGDTVYCSSMIPQG
jgi:hypothetical protein